MPIRIYQGGHEAALAFLAVVSPACIRATDNPSDHPLLDDRNDNFAVFDYNSLAMSMNIRKFDLPEQRLILFKAV
ncbi:MAG: hypothetical protein ACXV5H_01045 [Halobacteriota archaeon]